MKSTRRVVVVTGATGGIGRASCIRLARAGYDIIGQFRTQEDQALALQRQIADLSQQAHMISADLTDLEDVSHLVAEVESRIDPSVNLVGLVNNAAKLLGPAFEDATPEDFDEYVSLNTKAPFFLVQRLSPLMVSGGSIVNVSSVATRFASSGDIVYAMSKAALEALTYHAAEALAERHVRINTLMPGFTDNGHPAFGDPRVRDFMSSFSALGDVAIPEAIAESVSFLISDASARTTGSVLDVSGGSALGRRPAEGSITGLLG